jgi:hypothetical protein
MKESKAISALRILLAELDRRAEVIRILRNEAEKEHFRYRRVLNSPIDKSFDVSYEEAIEEYRAFTERLALGCEYEEQKT